jgi:hypothetical protein
MSRIIVLRSTDRAGWTPLADPPGELPSGGHEITAFITDDGTFTCGLWEREPDTWSFERPYDEVAYILAGDADIETEDGRTLTVGPGDVVVTPKGSAGSWRIREALTKFYAIYAGGDAGDTWVRTIRRDDPVGWIQLENPPGDEDPPGEEWYAWRNADGRFSTGVWRRVPEAGALERSGFHEIALMIDGEVDVETDDGSVLAIGPGDVLVTPDGTKGMWRAKSAVRKFWAVAYV